jgi:hypothetical protein
MPFVPIPNTVKVETCFSWDSQAVENVYHVRVSGDINEALLDNLNSLFYTWWSQYPANLQANTLLVTRTIISDASQQYGVAKEYAPGVINAGQVTNSPALPNNVSVAVKWNTGLRGRSYRGRTYHLGLYEAAVTGNNVIPTTVAALISAYTALMTTLDAQGYELVVASRFQGNLPRVTGVATPALTVTCDSTIDSQRRRLPGRGA